MSGVKSTARQINATVQIILCMGGAHKRFDGQGRALYARSKESWFNTTPFQSHRPTRRMFGLRLDNKINENFLISTPTVSHKLSTQNDVTGSLVIFLYIFIAWEVTLISHKIPNLADTLWRRKPSYSNFISDSAHLDYRAMRSACFTQAMVISTTVLPYTATDLPRRYSILWRPPFWCLPTRSSEISTETTHGIRRSRNKFAGAH